jgi:general secretion pathway protein E
VTAPSAETSLEILATSEGLVSAEAVDRVALVRAETGERFCSVATRLGLVSEAALAEAISRRLNLPLARVEDFPADPLELSDLSPRFLRENLVLPIGQSSRGITLAMVDPTDDWLKQAVSFALKAPVQTQVAKEGELSSALDRLYPIAASLDSELGEADEADLERLKDLASDVPVVRAVNAIIARAADLGASDIHLEPAEDSLKVRLRVDGVLQEQESLAPTMRGPVVSRIKVMSGLNIAERRLPQDGRLRQAVRGHEIDMRVATSPTIHGESVVMRLLDRSNLALDFVRLGFGDELLARFRQVLNRPHGIVLVTGPTGSGKTTTLYTALDELNEPHRKILTIEDPIEYRLAGINQTQVQPNIGLTFATALRSFLRQDPEVIMVGEIRDLETASIAVQAALTGHGILSTLHTNSAPAAISRLVDMGIEPFLITSTVNGVLAQRLVRRLCQECRAPYQADPQAVRSAFGSPNMEVPNTLFHPVGCKACNHTGYRGRLAILELLEMSDEVVQAVHHRGDERSLMAASQMTSMFQDGMSKASNGLTTVEEILRVTRDT